MFYAKIADQVLYTKHIIEYVNGSKQNINQLSSRPVNFVKRMMGTARFQMATVVAMYQLYFKSTKQKIAAQRYLSSRLIKQPYTECPDMAKSLSDCNLDENK